MEVSKTESDSRWAKFVDSFEDYMSANPFVELDDVYMTSHEKAKLFEEATSELNAKINHIRKQKKHGVSNQDKDTEKNV